MIKRLQKAVSRGAEQNLFLHQCHYKKFVHNRNTADRSSFEQFLNAVQGTLWVEFLSGCFNTNPSQKQYG